MSCIAGLSRHAYMYVAVFDGQAGVEAVAYAKPHLQH